MTAWPDHLTCRPIDAWPGEFTRRRQHAPFRAAWSSTVSGLSRELRHLGGKNAVLMLNLREQDIRLDGMPRATARPEHPGVILAFDSKHGPLKYPCDTYTDWQDNLRAIVLAMDALRRVDRYGVTKRGEQYTGWKALPAGRGDAASGMTTTEAQEVLVRAAGHQPGTERLPPGVLKDLLREARKRTHPDQNDGDTGQWNLVDNAMQALKRAGWMP